MRDDTFLTEAYKHGDSRAFEILYKRHVDSVFSHVYLKTHHKETTEDIVSQTFLKAMERIQSFDPLKGSFAGWIHKIAKNLVIDYFRRLRPAENIEDIWDIASESDVQKDAEMAIKLNEIQVLLQNLSPAQRSIVLLRVWHGYSFAEIADILETTEAAAKMQYKRTVKSIQKALLILLFLFFLPSFLWL